MMKKQILLIGLMSLITLTVVGQKKELKATDKALKSGDLALAQTSLAKCEKLIESADNKSKAKYYFLKGKTYSEIYKKQKSLDKNAFEIALKSLDTLFDFEKKINKKTYSADGSEVYNSLLLELKGVAVKQYRAKDYLMAAKNFYKVYTKSVKDTFMLDNAANSAHLAKDFKLALKYYLELNELGYKGVSTEYQAKNIETGQVETFGSKKERDFIMKTGKYSNSEDKTTKSRSISIIKNIAYLYGQLGENEKGLAAIRKAREKAPNDYNLLLSEADLQIKLGNRVKFAELMKEAVDKNPNEPILYFNLGVISNEQNKDEEAIKFYNKAIELNPDYFDAYINLAVVMRKSETKIIDEMNESLSDFDKYDKLQLKLSDLYKIVMPVYEKAYEIKKDDISLVQTLMGIYENLEMESKLKAMKATYDAMRN